VQTEQTNKQAKNKNKTNKNNYIMV